MVSYGGFVLENIYITTSASLFQSSCHETLRRILNATRFMNEHLEAPILDHDLLLFLPYRVSVTLEKTPQLSISSQALEGSGVLHWNIISETCSKSRME